MTNGQRYVLIGIAVVAFCLLVYPPWHYEGNAWVLSYSRCDWVFDSPRGATLDFPRLAAELGGLLVVGGTLYLACRK